MNDSLSESRAQLRRILVGKSGPTSAGNPGFFPRSKVMRAIVDPDRRGLWIAAATITATLFPPVFRLGSIGSLVSKYRQVSRHLSGWR
jgi:hypothetical protein